jgi:hypothetical protein
MDTKKKAEEKQSPEERATPQEAGADTETQKPEAKEVGGPTGPEPTRYGDWERKGRCVDF